MKSIVVVADCLEEHAKVDATLRMLTEAVAALNAELKVVSVSTAELQGIDLSRISGLLLGPGRYAVPEATILAAKCFRERRAPVLGTGNGFQHMVIDLARSCLGLSDATHQEYAPSSSSSVVTRLPVPLRAVTAETKIASGSNAQRLYANDSVTEQYFCRFGIDQEVSEQFKRYVVGETNEGGIVVATIIEDPDHPFYLGTLFLPQMGTNGSGVHPLISGFVEAIVLN